MKTEQLFSQKAFILQEPNLDKATSLEVAKTIFNQERLPSRIFDIKLQDSCEDFDTYKIKGDASFFNLKISFEKDNQSLKREASFLSGANKTTCPELIAYGNIKIGEQISYLISKHQIAESFSELGRGFFIENFDSFLRSYKIFQESERPISYLFFDNISNLIDYSDIKNQFFEESINAINSYSDLSRLESIFNDLNNEITNSYKEEIFNKDDVVHGDLNLNNILFRNNFVKFINLQKSFKGNKLIDLSNLLMDCGISKYEKRTFLKKFTSFFGYIYDSSLQDEFDYIEKINSILLLNNLIRSYLLETYFLGSSRPNKFLGINSSFSHNSYLFNNIQTFKKNSEFIIATITEPILGIKAISK